MWTYCYKHGDRPLDGYTIQRAAGRGGFGEVYYALSDSGREVALKVVQGYEDVELRGISQCMNLKSPHLVTIFDVRHDPDGVPFVVMEYVAGPNLRELLDQNPSGLGEQKAAFFLREIAKGLTFLHEAGIVHRDLKPANIFYENGYVKIGDYGLSKSISGSHHSAQTVTVGTVHYMAPEVGAGRYDRSIDIYALGACLYEMLTGTVPFVGASASEVLMKHLTREPDLTGISEPFATVIRKAMCKDPARRYQTVQEMVEAVYGAEHVRQSVSVFSPEDLSFVAGRAFAREAAAVGAGAGAGLGDGRAFSSSSPGIAGTSGMWEEPIASRGPSRSPSTARFERLQRMFTAPSVGKPFADPLSSRQRGVLLVVVAVASALASAFFSYDVRGKEELVPFLSYMLIMGAALGTIIGVRTIMPGLEHEPRSARRLIMGAMMGVGAAILSAPLWAGVPRFVPTVGAVVVAVSLLDAMRVIRADRPTRVSLREAMWPAIVALIAASILGGSLGIAITTAAGAALAIQLLFPWNPNAAMAEAVRRRQSPQRTGTPPVPAVPPLLPVQALQRAWRPGPVWRSVWIVAAIIAFAAAVGGFVAAGESRYWGDITLGVTFGVVASLLGALCVVRAASNRFYGWWQYLVRPLLAIACVGLICFTSCVAGGLRSINGSQAAMIMLGLLSAGAGLVALLFLPGKSRAQAESRLPDPAPPAAVPPATSAPPSSRSSPGEPWRGSWLGGLLTAVAGMFLFVALVAGTSLALALPAMLAAGIPDRQLTNELERDVFAGYPAWPALLNRIGVAVVAVIATIGVALLLVARRSGGLSHLIRAVLGACCLFASLGLLNLSFTAAGRSPWSTIAPLIETEQFAEALDRFLDAFMSKPLSLAVGMFLAGIVLLAWPRRHNPRPEPAAGEVAHVA